MKGWLAIIAVILLSAFASKANGASHYQTEKPTPSGQLTAVSPDLALEGRDLALRVDARLDRLREPRIRIKDTSRWVDEILPFFVIEGVTPKSVRPKVIYERMDDADHRLVAGNTDCAGEVRLNKRYANPVSHWFRRVDLISTLVHEMAHAQSNQYENQCSLDSEYAETSTQIVALEVMAGLAVDGNKVVFYSLLDELRFMGLAMVLSSGLASNQLDDYYQLLTELFPEDAPSRIARLNKNIREFGAETLAHLLDVYYGRVWDQVKTALARPLHRLKLDVPAGHRFYLDDLSYILAHLEEMG